MKLYSYVVKYDTGLAPNPYGGYCTLAVCTPNHSGIKAQAGDWILGSADVKHEYALIYVMRVGEVLHFDEYFKDPRFASKVPARQGSWAKTHGDNMYHTDASGKWVQVPTRFHNDNLEQDTKHPYVFIAEQFYYFGCEAFKIPAEFESLIKRGQGCKANHQETLVCSFLEWLSENHTVGKNAEPRDREKVVCNDRQPPHRRSRLRVGEGCVSRIAEELNCAPGWGA